MSEKKQPMEDELHRLRRENSLLVKALNAPGNIMFFTLDRNYNYTSFNRAHQMHIKRTWGADIFSGMNILELFDSPEDLATAKKHFDRALGGESYILKRKYPEHNGKEQFYENTYSPLIEAGEVVGVCVFAHDITKWSEKEKYQDIFENALEGIFRSTPEGRFIDANQEMARILGYTSPQDLLGSISSISNQLYCNPGERDRVMNLLRKHGLVKDFVTTMFTKTGDTIWVEFNARCAKNKQGQTLYVEGKLTDVSQRKQAEAEAERRRQQTIQAEKMTSLGLLVTGVAHEINNPNSYLTLNLPLIRDMWKDSQTILEEYYRENGDFVLGGLEYSEVRMQMPPLLNEMIQGAARINAIVSQLKDYARQSRDGELEDVDLNRVVDDSMTFVRHKIKHSARTFEFNRRENLPMVQGNMQRLMQVFINLVVNACEAIQPEDGRITITTMVRTAPQGKEALIQIQDNGCGIDPEDLHFIQDPFYTTKRDQGGTGLGLSISATIMRQHQGRLEFDSGPEGTAARMIIPVQEG